MLLPVTVLILVLLLLVSVVACTPNADPQPTEPSPFSTATENVHVLPPLRMRKLGRERHLRVYLPPGYDDAAKRYPVVYMHDAQNLFDAATSYVGEWGVDETLNALADDGFEIIVVGIDHGAELRISELSPWQHEYAEQAEGASYLEFVTATVKPFIDKRYRTRPEREHTAIFGSSLGGLMSHFAITSRGDVFSKAGIFSPSYPLTEAVFEYTQRNPPPPDTDIYILAGAREGQAVVDSVTRMHSELHALGHDSARLTVEIDPHGEHNEAFWGHRFGTAIRTLFAAP